MVKTYNLVDTYSCGEPWREMEEATEESGDWVRKEDYEALAATLAKYQACRVHDVDEKNWLRDRVTDLETAILNHNTKALNAGQSTWVIPMETARIDFTLGYRTEVVERIIDAKNGPNDPTAPADPDKFMEWLHAAETAVVETQCPPCQLELGGHRCGDCGYAEETVCTCDSTLVTDTSNHQPHCPRYKALYSNPDAALGFQSDAGAEPKKP